MEDRAESCLDPLSGLVAGLAVELGEKFPASLAELLVAVVPLFIVVRDVPGGKNSLKLRFLVGDFLCTLSAAAAGADNCRKRDSTKKDCSSP